MHLALKLSGLIISAIWKVRKFFNFIFYTIKMRGKNRTDLLLKKSENRNDADKYKIYANGW